MTAKPSNVASDLNRLALLAEEAADCCAEGGAETKLAGLLDEMQALARMLPAGGYGLQEGRADVVAQLEEDAVEAGFDNMPV
ncbi:MAG: hypothetical protein WCC57_18600 [Paracoccaceae bacterium]